MKASGWIDIGHDVQICYVAWAPDRDLNPQYDGIPDQPKFGLQIAHQAMGAVPCFGFVTFDGEVQRLLAEREGKKRPLWQVDSWDPLTISPSVLCRACGFHGWIRNGRWEPA